MVFTSSPIYSVSEAKKLKSGKIIVTGIVSSLSTQYLALSHSRWECPNCNECGSRIYTPPRMLPPKNLDNITDPELRCFKCNSTAFTVNSEYRTAKTIQIIDADNNHNENYDSLEVVLYDESWSNAFAGEIVEITGALYVQPKIQSANNGNHKKLITVLHSNSLNSKHREEIVVTSEDIEIIKRHKAICERAYQSELESIQRNPELVKKIKPMRYIDRLVAMFAPNVIGHNDKKLGLLRSIVGARSDHGTDNGRRGRINTLLVGDPGTAKSTLAREASYLLPNSRYVTAQNASGKSLIAIVDKENDSLICRYGAAVLAKGAICAINEIGAMNPTDQQFLLDIAEEGKCTLDKYGTHFEIDAPTTIIATANPYNHTWNKGFNINKDEIPLLKPLLDRCDLVYGFVDAPSEREIEEYTIQKTRIRNRPGHNYNFLKKFVVYAKTIQPIMNSDVQDRLNKFWTHGKLQGAATNRTYDSIFRIAEAQARLNLSDEITDDIATQTMDSISLMLSQYGKVVQTIQSPRDVTYDVFVNILKQTKSGILITQLCRIACEENKQVSEYLGENWEVQRNRKLRTVVEMLENHTKIKVVKAKPLVLQYFDEVTSDTYDITIKASQNNVVQSTTDVSDVYDATSGNMKTLPTFMTEDENHPLSDLSDTYDVTVTNTNKSADVSINVQNQCPSDIYDTYDTTTDMQFNSEQGSCNIFRLGHSDIWACKLCRQKGDIHYMKEHLCRGEMK
jgi:DNA replicative helicase MCM subunit Mcm2 (Cdc46/Mcm family)